MEDLNKQQLILLTLLVSFVTSIATGIITFALIKEAPVAVTQNINRVVERTIERVVPEEGGGTIKEVTTVVSEEDLVLESIDKNVKSIVRLKTLGADGKELVTGLGLVVSADGLIATDEKSFGSGNYSVILFDKTVYSVAKSYKDPSSGLIFLKLGRAAGDTYHFYPAILGNVGTLKLGQTLIAVGGRDRNTVLIGRISDLEKTDAGEVIKISTDARVGSGQSGSPILNLNGEVVGLQAPAGEGAQTLSYNPINILQKALKTAATELAK